MAIGIGNTMWRRGGGVNWSSYWASLISATVENADPDAIVLTFPTAQTSLTDTDFTVTVNGGAVAVSSASWAGAVLTLVLASACVYGDVIVVTFVRSGGTVSVTNNIVAEQELLDHIAALVTPISDQDKKDINDFLLILKAGFSISHTNEVFDWIRLYMGETQESSLRNLVKDDHHATVVGAVSWAQFEGITGEGGYIRTDYIPKTDKVRYSQNSAHLAVYNSLNVASGTGTEMGSIATGGVGTDYFRIATGGSNVCLIKLNTNGDTQVATAYDRRGLFIANRVAASSQQFYRNNALIVSGSRSSSGLSDYELYELSINNLGVQNEPSNRRLALSTGGRGLSEAERGIIQNAIASYRAAKGKEFFF